ncbi:F-box/FBD/LRR-repeat protein-like protein [Tanacetum coccineum]
MEVQGLPTDTMNNLPSSIIQKIVTHMPIRDAFRTSILSKNWRDYCLNLSKLKFDDEVFQAAALKFLSISYKLLYVIYPILLLHKGPILDFSLCSSQLSSCCEIDQIILHLSRNATVEKFTLSIGVGDGHKLLPSFFTLQQLVRLELRNCAFQPPSAFKGFSKLISLSFDKVSITSKALLRFILNCPLLKDFTLIGDEKHFMGCWNSDFVELFECLPIIECLHMSSYPIKCFAIGVIPKKLPTSLDHLIYLRLSGVSFGREIELQSVLLLVTSSPKIETIVIDMDHNPKEAVSQIAMNLIDLQEYSHFTLDHLRVIQIKDFSNMKPGMDFVKLILAKSPMLKLVDIMIDGFVDIHEEIKMLKELIQYPRASTRAEIIFERP